MPVMINSQTYYRTAEACRIVGVSRNTLFRWLQKGILTGAERRDSRGWRLFTRQEIDTLSRTINAISGAVPE